jgi:hypothetical protein
MSTRRILNIQATRKRRSRQRARRDLLNFENLEHGLRYRTLIPASDWWVAFAWWRNQEADRPSTDTVTVEWMPVVAWAILTTENRDEDERVVPLVVDEEAGTPALCPVQLWEWGATNYKSLGLYREADRTDPARQLELQRRAETARDDKRARAGAEPEEDAEP